MVGKGNNFTHTHTRIFLTLSCRILRLRISTPNPKFCCSASCWVIEKEAADAANVGEVCWVYVKQVSQYMCGQLFDCISSAFSLVGKISEIIAAAFPGVGEELWASFLIVLLASCTVGDMSEGTGAGGKGGKEREATNKADNLLRWSRLSAGINKHTAVWFNGDVLPGIPAGLLSVEDSLH